MKKTVGLLFSLVALVNLAFSQGYEIKVKINGLKNVPVILGHYFETKMIPDDTARLDNNGQGVFKKSKPLPGGMYLVYMPNRTYFDILISDNQKFSFENDTTDYVNRAKFTNDKQNQVFFDYQKFIIKRQKESKDIREKMKDSTINEKVKKDYGDKLTKIDSDVKVEMDKVINENPTLFLSTFLKATREVEIPQTLPDDKKYYWYKDHFFDNFDVSDCRLLRTPLYDPKIKTYIQKVIPQMPDSIIPYVDMLIKKSRACDEMFRYMLITLFNEYASSNVMGMDAVYVHIAEKYYINEATWSDKKFIDELKEKIPKKKPLLIGKKLPDNKFLLVPYDYLMKSLTDSTAMKNYFYGDYINVYDVQSKYFVLIFWESDCSHCQAAMPVLHRIYNRLKSKGLEVMAVHMLSSEEGKRKWCKFVKKENLDGWLNVWDPAYVTKYKDKYDVSSTPVVYMTDKDKKIIAKRIGVEECEKICIGMMLEEKLGTATGKEKLNIMKDLAKSYPQEKEGLKAMKDVYDRGLVGDEKTEMDVFLDKLIDAAK